MEKGHPPSKVGVPSEAADGTTDHEKEMAGGPSVIYWGRPWVQKVSHLSRLYGDESDSWFLSW
jgi:hypothetical protein